MLMQGHLQYVRLAHRTGVRRLPQLLGTDETVGDGSMHSVKNLLASGVRKQCAKHIGANIKCICVCGRLARR